MKTGMMSTSGSRLGSTACRSRSSAGGE
uniref:Uncharacterized protein n=1 Tax=Arundo donax TaxID=35708 RepID=A0A0A8ZG18_ARUDO